MRQSAKSAMGRGVAIAANNSQAGQRKALLGARDMHDALANIVHSDIFETELGAVFFQSLDLQFAFRIRNRIDPASAVGRRNIVIC